MSFDGDDSPSKHSSKSNVERISFDQLNGSGSGKGSAAKERVIRVSRNESKYWRDVRAASLNCKNFQVRSSLGITNSIATL